MTACNFCGKKFKDSETRDSHIKKEHMNKLTKNVAKYLVVEKKTPVENVARHFSVGIDEVQKLIK